MNGVCFLMTYISALILHKYNRPT